MSRGTALAVVPLALMLGACSSVQPRADRGSAPGIDTSFIVAHPPSMAAAARAASAPAVSVPPGSARLVWVPDWKLYLREGRDVVEYDDRYFLWSGGQWHVGITDQGPWRPLTPDRPVETAQPPAQRWDADQAPPSGTAAGARVVHLAKRHVGARYVWGGSDPSGFDCSGFVMYVYAKLGVALPHNAARQYAYGMRVGRDDLRPGDLVFFDGLRHNGIYIGGGEFIHASQRGRGVRISELDNPWFRQRWVGGRRLHLATSER